MGAVKTARKKKPRTKDALGLGYIKFPISLCEIEIRFKEHKRYLQNRGTYSLYKMWDDPKWIREDFLRRKKELAERKALGLKTI